MNTRLVIAAGLAAATLLSACASTEGDEPANPAAGAPAGDDVPAGDQLTDPDETDPPAEPIDDAPTDGAPTGGVGDCRVEQPEAPVEDERLPAAVVATRDLLLDAARRCDEQLLRTAIDESSQFNFSFGGDEDAIGFWNDLAEAGEDPYQSLVDVLLTTPALADGDVAWVWPAATTGRPETLTPELLAELDRVEDGTRAQVEAGRSYLGWRVGISPDGEWRFFVRGD